MIRRDFDQVIALAGVVRDAAGFLYDAYTPAPRFAALYRNWRARLNDDRLDRLAKPLALSYALAKGFEPGLWRPQDIEIKAEDRTFAGRLKNLGSAVRTVGALGR